MSRSWIAFYIGDYLKDTQALSTEQHGAYLLLLMECWQKGRVPLDAAGRASVARLPLQRWKKISAPIDAFFAADGTNKRATTEITKAEMVSLKRAMAGAAGGRRTGLAKAIVQGQHSKIEANAVARLQHAGRQTHKQNRSISAAIHTTHITTSSLVAAREAGGEQFFVIFDTPEWHAHQRHRAQNAMPQLEPITLLRDGIAYRGARVPYPTPPGYRGSTEPAPAEIEPT
jgi:uncharacterized protein YdaU (DUF1376 family)